jgi:hypothetical protein
MSIHIGATECRSRPALPAIAATNVHITLDVEELRMSRAPPNQHGKR